MTGISQKQENHTYRKFYEWLFISLTIRPNMAAKIQGNSMKEAIQLVPLRRDGWNALRITEDHGIRILELGVASGD